MRLFKNVFILLVLISLPSFLYLFPNFFDSGYLWHLSLKSWFTNVSNLNLFYVVPIVIYCALLLTFIYKIYRCLKPKWRVKKAAQVIDKLRSFEGDNKDKRVLYYLRKIDPFVFEELLLNCFKEAGFKIKRNKRYTGDGGIDGRIWVKRKKILIQAKRYKGHIKKSDVVDFENVCQKQKKYGLFVHTGLLGKGAANVFDESNRIHCFSADNLVLLILSPKEVKSNFILPN